MIVGCDLVLTIAFRHILYTNIDQTLLNKWHGQTHCKIGGTCVYNGHVFYALL